MLMNAKELSKSANSNTLCVIPELWLSGMHHWFVYSQSGYHLAALLPSVHKGEELLLADTMNKIYDGVQCFMDLQGRCRSCQKAKFDKEHSLEFTDETT